MHVLTNGQIERQQRADGQTCLRCSGSLVASYVCVCVAVLSYLEVLTNVIHVIIVIYFNVFLFFPESSSSLFHFVISSCLTC